MKKIIAAALSFCIIGGAATAAAVHQPGAAAFDIVESYREYVNDTLFNGVDEYMHYNVYSDHAVLALCEQDCIGDVVVPDEIEGVPVTSVAASAFSGCSGVKTIVLPESVESVGRGAFSGCSSLVSIKLPQKLSSLPDIAFDGCKALAEINIPDGMKNFGVQAFRNCSSLAEFTFPEGTGAVSNGIFYGCSGLEKVSVPDSVTIIGVNSFYGCKSLAAADIPASVKAVGSGAFFGCSSLTSVLITEGVKAVRDNSFLGCSGLTFVTVAENVSSIGSSAFAQCSGLASIIILNPECEIADDIRTVSSGYRTSYQSNSDDSIFYTGTIAGYTGSTAEAYAEKYGYDFVPLDGDECVNGDANCDGKLNMADAVMIMQYVSNPDKYALSDIQKSRADFFGSDGVTNIDALMIQRGCLNL